MKKFFAVIRNTFIVLLLLYVTSKFVDIQIEGVKLDTIYETAAKQTYKFFDSLVDQIKSEPEVTDFTISYVEEDTYRFDLVIKYVDENELVSIKISDKTYTEFNVVKDKKTIKVSFTDEIQFEPNLPNKTFNIQSIEYMRNETVKSLESSVSGNAFKSLDMAIVEEKKQSVVGIHSCNRIGFRTECVAWGSGVIYDSTQETIDPLIGEDYIEYTYYILTNYHVVHGYSIFDIYYDSARMDTQATLVGTYTEKTDIAIVKLISRETLVVLDDDQFTTKTAVPIYLNQTVFSVGSPGGVQNFNQYKVGFINDLDYSVFLKPDPEKPSTLCATGCDSFSTTAALGQGSSGGAMFDTVGNLIGIHFAGDNDNLESYEVHMTTVLKAIDEIMATETASNDNSYIN